MAGPIRGHVEVKGNIKKLQQGTRRSMINAVRRFEEEELKEMIRRTPMKTGDLRESGEIIEPRIEGNKLIGGWRFTAPYAIYVHEDLEAFHPIGEAKFMESVMNESRPHFADRVGAYMKEDLGL